MKQCSDCREFLVDTRFYKRSDTGKPRSRCVSCHSKLMKAKNATPEAVERRRERHRKHHRFKAYGITKDIFDGMYDDQGGLCLICKDYMERPNIDHDHKTGKVRGLLCHYCNIGIGVFRDDEERLLNAIDYLRTRHRD